MHINIVDSKDAGKKHSVLGVEMLGVHIIFARIEGFSSRRRFSIRHVSQSSELKFVEI
jgi:hypothetical protein